MSEPSPLPAKSMPLAFKIPIIGIPLLTIAMLAPSGRLAFLALAGRTSQCSFWQVENSPRVATDRALRSAAIKQSTQRLQSDANYTLWRTRDGDFWIPNRNADTLIFNLTEQEQDIYGRGEAGVHPGDIVLDGGANVGVFTRKALDAGARTVVAIEPAPENVESLRRNFAEIVSGRVVLQAVGLWNQRAELPLRVDGSNSARNSFVLSFGPAASSVIIPLLTIDSLVDSLALTSVDFIKLDIEGAEKNAIAGAKQTVARFRPRLSIAMEHMADDTIAIPAAIRSLGQDYVTACGPCLDHQSFVRPETLYFAPRAKGR